MSQSQQQARKRGANYTQEEKSLLLDLVMQYKHIIECKRTGGKFIEKKREAWADITIKYNSNCTSGTRDTDQLKSLYDNMKQKSRKDVGESNKLAYITEQNRMVTQEDVARAIRNIKEDKIEMNKTGGGSWRPKMSDNDAKVLAIIQDQVEPLCNPYDSASGFFKGCGREYIKKKANFCLRVQPLESRHNTNFKAFVVRIPPARLDLFMKEYFWPQGVVYRRFRGMLPCATEPTQKVSN